MELEVLDLIYIFCECPALAPYICMPVRPGWTNSICIVERNPASRWII